MNTIYIYELQIRLSNGDEEMLPSICFVIPPPNHDAISQADR